jgi:uncharacterized protein YqeY
MALRDQLQSDLKAAMKSGDDLRKTVIRGALAALKNEEQKRRDELTEKAITKHGVTRPIPARDPHDPAQIACEADGRPTRQRSTRHAAENVEEHGKLDDGAALTIVQKLVKQRQESIDQARQAGRTDIAESEERELKLLQAYLPLQMSREELEREARQVIAEVGATEVRDMGKVMSTLMARVQGRADGKMVSDVVRSLLSK